MNPVAVITGVQSEAKCLDALTNRLPPAQRHYIYCAGPGPDRAAIACRAIDDHELSGVVSFGLAGGLDPALAPGTLLLPSAVITSVNALYETDTAWRNRIAAALPARPPGTVQMGIDHAVTAPVDKERLFREYKTQAVDMESHAIALYAKSRRLPFLILRAVADTADEAIPDAAIAGLDETGNVVPFRVVRQLGAHPSQIPALIQLARDSGAAMAALKAIPKPAIDALCRIGEDENG